MKTSSKKWQKIRKIKGLRQFVTWYPRHVSENPGKICINKYVGCFMASSIKKMFFYKYGFSDMCTQKVLKQEVIVLPVKKDASPDWEYMEEYMKKMEKTAVERMNLLI